MTNKKDLFCRPSEERALIAYCMKDVNNYYSICSKLSASDFLYSQHELIMLTFASLVAKGATKLESNLLISEATATGILDIIGWAKYVQTIYNMILESANLDIYLSSVYEASVK